MSYQIVPRFFGEPAPAPAIAPQSPAASMPDPQELIRQYRPRPPLLERPPGLSVEGLKKLWDLYKASSETGVIPPFAKIGWETLKLNWKTISQGREIELFKGRAEGFANTLARIAAFPTMAPQRVVPPETEAASLGRRAFLEGYLQGYDAAMPIVMSSTRRGAVLDFLRRAYGNSALSPADNRLNIFNRIITNFIPEARWTPDQFYR
jgi:hypothetical protein